MNTPLALTALLIEALVLYLLVLGSHALRNRFGLGPFYALMGCLTAVMSWVTEIGINIELYDISFFVGSTVFYTSIMLGVFIVYVFDGPQATRLIISTVIGVSILIPVTLWALNLLMDVGDISSLYSVPEPGLRINVASVIATFLDMLFLAIAWEYLGKQALRLQLSLRTYLTLLGVMWLDVILFATGAFAGTDDYLTIMQGTFSSRFVISLFAFPVLLLYIRWQHSRPGISIEARPVLSIITDAAEVRQELTVAQTEIHDRKQIETALRKSEGRYRSLFENMFEGGYQTAPDGTILSANRALLDMLGYESQEELGAVNARDIYRNPEVRAELLCELEETGTLRDVEIAMKNKDGRAITVLENSSAIRDENGSVVRFEGTLRDITGQRAAERERILMEARLRESQKLEAIGTLASGVAHEINNPLTGMINFADLIQERVGDGELKEFARTIMDEGNRVATITGNLLAFAQQGPAVHTPKRITDIMNTSLSLTASMLRKQQITLEMDIPDALPLVRCHSQQIQQVMVNLLTNAMHALNQRYKGFHANKVIRISGRTVPEDDIIWVRVTIEDHGNGIHPDHVKHLFEPFFTTKDRGRPGTNHDDSILRGTGLGLSVSYGIVKDHGGHISVESEPGEYTKFHVDLKAIEVEPEE